MKNVNLPALGQVSLEDICLLITWLEKFPLGEISLDQIKRSPPIRGSKINPAVKVLEQFNLIVNKQNRILITPTGKDFARSSDSVRKAVVKGFFLKIEQVQRILDLLKTSATGRLHRSVVNESFNLGSISQIAESEILGFIAWAQTCDLFYHDKKMDEIFNVNLGIPRDPKEGPPLRKEIPTWMRLVF